VSLRSTITRRAGLGGLAVAGLIAGHCFAYRFFADAGPHAHHQPAHSHLPYLFALFAGLLVAVVGSFFDHRSGARGRSVPATALVLVAAQLGGFVALSILDRVTGTTGTEIGGRAFWAGMAIQVIAAGLGALVLVAFRKTIETVDRIMRAELPAEGDGDGSTFARPTLRDTVPSLAMAAGGPTFRGPPLDR
jgi:hypothetical protein